jgi:hypothetical protein
LRSRSSSNQWLHAQNLGSCLAQLNRCSLVLDFSWDDEEAVAGYWKLRASPQVHDDNNIEFMFRHAVPAPMFENMDACGCT